MDTPRRANLGILGHCVDALRPRPIILAALVIALGIGLVSWAQTDFGQRQFSRQSLALLLSGAACAVLAGLAVGHRPLLVPEEDGAKAARSALPRLRWRSWRTLALPLAVGLTFLAFWLNDDNLFTIQGTLCWFFAIILFMAVWWQRSPQSQAQPTDEDDPHSRRDRLLRVCWPLALFLLVAGVAAFFRFYQLDTLPGDAGGVEADVGDNVRDIADGRFTIYMYRRIGEGGLLYFTAGLVKIFGLVLDYNAIKATTALVGILAIGATYLLLKELFSDRFVALVGCLFMAVAHWPVTIARTSLMMAAAPLWSAIALLFLVRVLKYNRLNDFLLCGLTAGLGLYFYQGLRAVPFLIVACLALKFLVTVLARRWKETLSLTISGVLLGFTLLIVFAPMARTWHDDPEYYMQAVQSRSTGTETTTGYSAPGRFVTNMKNVSFMFNWIGDQHNLHNITGEPALDDAMAAFLLVGAALSVAAWLRYRRGLFPYVALAFIALLLPSALALAFPGENPSFARTAGAIPLTYGFVALPVCLALSCLQRSFSRMTGLVIVSLLLAGLMTWISLVNFRWYFHDYSDSYHSSTVNSSEIAAAIKEVKHRDSTITDVYIVGYPGWVDRRGVHLLLAQPDWLYGVYPIERDSEHVQTPGRKLYVLLDRDLESLLRLERLYPGGEVEWREEWPGSRGAFILFITPPAPQGEE